MPQLRPLAQRYAGWLALPAAATADTSDEDPALVRAMPLVLRIEREAAPRTSLLEAAARATLEVCLDPRSAPGGEWYEPVAAWVAGRIRKVSRRARGAHWAAVADLPGATVPVGAAEVRALVPGLVVDTPKVVSRLQITGVDLPADSPGPPPSGASVIWLNPHVELTVGKAAAQVGHAAMIDAAVRGLSEVPPYAVRVANPAQWREVSAAVERGTAVAVRDAGFTEVPPGTLTCAVAVFTGPLAAG